MADHQPKDAATKSAEKVKATDNPGPSNPLKTPEGFNTSAVSKTAEGPKPSKPSKVPIVPRTADVLRPTKSPKAPAGPPKATSVPGPPGYYQGPPCTRQFQGPPPSSHFQSSPPPMHAQGPPPPMHAQGPPLRPAQEPCTPRPPPIPMVSSPKEPFFGRAGLLSFLANFSVTPRSARPRNTGYSPEKSLARPAPPPLTELSLLSSQSGRRYVSALAAIITGLAALIIGIVVLAGSQSKALSNLHIVELLTNETYDTRVRVGYFGACISIAETPHPYATFDASIQTHCLANIHSVTSKTVVDKFAASINVPNDVRAAIHMSLTRTLLPSARHIQRNVFSYTLPVLHLVLFALGSSTLLTIVLNPASAYRHWVGKLRRIHMGSLFSGIFVSGLALTLDILAIGELQSGMSALSWAGVGEGIGVVPGQLVERYAVVQLVLVVLHYILIGALFVGGEYQSVKLEMGKV